MPRHMPMKVANSMLVCLTLELTVETETSIPFVVSKSLPQSHSHKYISMASHQRFVCPMTINFTHWFVALTRRDTIREWCARCFAFSDSNVSHNEISEWRAFCAIASSIRNGFGRSHIFTPDESWRTVWVTIFNRISNLNKLHREWPVSIVFSLKSTLRHLAWMKWKTILFEVVQFRSIQFPHERFPHISIDATDLRRPGTLREHVDRHAHVQYPFSSTIHITRIGSNSPHSFAARPQKKWIFLQITVWMLAEH